MQNRTKRNAILIWLLVLFLIVMACDPTNIDPDDERLQEPVQNIIENFEDFFGDIGVDVKGSTPYIRYVVPSNAIINQDGKIKYEITIDEKFHDYISVFSITPQGCKASFSNPQIIATFENNSEINGETTATFYAKPGTIITVAGTEDNENYGPYSEYFRLLTEEEVWTPQLITPEANEHLNNDEEVLFKAKAYPELCMSLEIDGETVDQASVDENGNWEMTVDTLDEGNHNISIIPENLDNKTAKSLDFSIQLSPEEAKIGEIVPIKDNENSFASSYSRQDSCGIKSNCTWYAAEAVKTYSNGKILLTNLGGAIKWPTSAKSNKYVASIDRIPEVASIIYLYHPSKYMLGHVAFVESVIYDNDSREYTITWSEESANIPDSPQNCNPFYWHNSNQRITVNNDENGSVYRWRITKSFDANDKGEVDESGYDIYFIHLIYD